MYKYVYNFLITIMIRFFSTQSKGIKSELPFDHNGDNDDNDDDDEKFFQTKIKRQNQLIFISLNNQIFCFVCLVIYLHPLIHRVKKKISNFVKIQQNKTRNKNE